MRPVPIVPLSGLPLMPMSAHRVAREWLVLCRCIVGPPGRWGRPRASEANRPAQRSPSPACPDTLSAAPGPPSSNPSTSDPVGSRRYLGGPSLLNAALTVFLARPMTRAICEIDMASGRRKRRISAQSSTPNTRFLPCSVQARVSGKLVNFQLPRADQYSVAVDSHSQHPTTPARMTPSRVHGPQHDHL